MPSFDSCLAFTIRQEGGLVFSAEDAGGITNHGISIHTLAEYRSGVVTAEDVRNLTMKDARAVYEKLFWERMGLGRFDAMPALQLALFDFGVNSGCDAATRSLQNVLMSCGQPVKLDGLLGPKTFEACQRVSASIGDVKLGIVLTRARRMLMARICQRDKSQVVFLAGWIGRTHALDDAMNAFTSSQTKGSP